MQFKHVQRYRRYNITWFALIIALFMAISTSYAQDTFESESLEIDLGEDFVSQAELTYPTQGEGPFPLVILFHGSGPYDMDATSYNADGTVSSANFELIAETLPEDGIAVLRFNKRGVIGDGEYDMAQINTSSLDRLVADANAVVDTALTLEQVDTDRIYLYGWSEGAWVVSNVAAGRDDIAGLILQGASDGSLETELPYQLQEIFLSYVTETGDTDGDGALSLEEIAAIEGGSVLTWRNYFLLDQTSTLPDGLVVNTFVDQNGDELIDIESELEPMLDMFITNYSLYAPEVDASYETAELIAEMDMSVLLLHGEMDGWIEFANAEMIQEAAPERVTLQAYPELGHALSPTSELAADVLGEMDAAPLEDVAAWILSQE